MSAMAYQKPGWLAKLPTQNWAQAAAFAGMVLFGAIVQWNLSPRGAVKVKIEAK